jgi:4-hydroxyphenylpyruvate dioxygenase-like putative hemolysin
LLSRAPKRSGLPKFRAVSDTTSLRFPPSARDLDAGWLAELMEFGIFSDRNADGEYLNFYTTPFEDRFFFEFVEHRGAYHDYGIVNVPMRLAALAQWRMSNGNSAPARPKQTVRGGLG